MAKVAKKATVAVIGGAKSVQEQLYESVTPLIWHAHQGLDAVLSLCDAAEGGNYSRDAFEFAVRAMREKLEHIEDLVSPRPPST